jgi:hypothetical protein
MATLPGVPDGGVAAVMVRRPCVGAVGKRHDHLIFCLGDRSSKSKESRSWSQVAHQGLVEPQLNASLALVPVSLLLIWRLPEAQR